MGVERLWCRYWLNKALDQAGIDSFYHKTLGMLIWGVVDQESEETKKAREFWINEVSLNQHHSIPATCETLHMQAYLKRGDGEPLTRPCRRPYHVEIRLLKKLFPTDPMDVGSMEWEICKERDVAYLVGFWSWFRGVRSTLKFSHNFWACWSGHETRTIVAEGRLCVVKRAQKMEEIMEKRRVKQNERLAMIELRGPSNRKDLELLYQKGYIGRGRLDCFKERNKQGRW